jgi:hypothetical protein
MMRFAIAMLMSAAAWGQLTTDVLSKAPPAVDEALRARISRFYQLHVDGKFRQAEELVADDSKDFFYSANKPKYTAFEISRIDYSENFTKAKATVVCHMYVMVPGFTDKPLPVPTPSLWKQVNSQWYWYIDQAALNRTPFGTMQAGSAGSSPAASLPAMPSPEQAMKLLEQVAADRSEVRLNSDRPSTAQVTIKNGMPGVVSLAVSAPKVEGLEIKPDQPSIKAGESGTVTFRYKPGKSKPAGPIAASIRVEQTGQTIPVQIVFGK